MENDSVTKAMNKIEQIIQNEHLEIISIIQTHQIKGQPCNSSKSGVPNLSLTMYPSAFRKMSIYPLQHFNR